MNNDSLTQYLRLYDDAHAAIAAHSPEALNRLRPGALDALRAFRRLPHTGDEGYALADPDAMFAPDYGLNLTRLPFAADLSASFRCDIPNISTLLGVVVNDTFRPTAALEKNLPEGVRVMSLARAAEEFPEIVGARLGKLSANASAPTALNTLLAQDGLFVHIRKGTRLEKAIQIVNILSSAAPLMAVRRVLVVAEADSSARLLLCDHAQGSTAYMASQVVEIFADERCELDIYDIEKNSAATARMSECYLRQDAGSKVSINACSLTGGDTRNSFCIDVCGDGATTTVNGIAIGSGRQTVDNAVRLRHGSRRSTSRQLFKYALFDDARGSFGGRIIVEEGAEFTDASQTDRNLLASAGARMHSEPQLEIYCDEVKCSHGATTGQLDARALFYMQSRGIPEEEARMMLIQAFMSDLVEAISLPPLRDRMRQLVEKRLGCGSAACGDCTATCATNKSEK